MSARNRTRTARVAAAVALVAGLALAGCGDPEPRGAAPTPLADLSGFRLDVDPGGAAGVSAARTAAPLDAAVVFGRVSGLVPGLAAFQLTDDALEYCGRSSPEDSCRTPWDYCCLAGDEVRDSTLLVEFPDEDGEARAGAIGDLRPLDLVVVTGALHRDEHGNVRLAATGYLRRERPAVGDQVRWPGGG